MPVGLFFKEDRMSKTIRKILGEAYKFIGLAPNGILHEGQVGEGVEFANEVIRKYNESSLFPFTYTTLETNVSGGLVSLTTQPRHPGEVLAEVPVGMAAVYFKRSDNEYIDVEKLDYKDIFRVRNSSASPEWYSLVPVDDAHATVHFDALGTFRALLVYPRAIPELKIDDTFNAPEIYCQVIKYGVAVRAATRATFETSVIADYQKLLDDAVNAVMESSASRKPMKRNFGRVYDRHAEFTCPRVRL